MIFTAAHFPEILNVLVGAVKYDLFSGSQVWTYWQARVQVLNLIKSNPKWSLKMKMDLRLLLAFPHPSPTFNLVAIIRGSECEGNGSKKSKPQVCVRVPKSSPISQLEFLYWTNMNSFQTIISRACHYGLQDQDCKFLISTRPPPPAPTRHINTDHPSSSLSHLESWEGGERHEDYPGAGCVVSRVIEEGSPSGQWLGRVRGGGLW